MAQRDQQHQTEFIDEQRISEYPLIISNLCMHIRPSFRSSLFLDPDNVDHLLQNVRLHVGP
jgi:hypothetical protein